jgi:hypothetical protein
VSLDELLDRGFDPVSNPPNLRHDLLVASRKGRRIGEGPMELIGEAGENRAALGGFLRTDRNDRPRAY